MARTSTRRWKGCPMCKYHKDASYGDVVRMPPSALRQFPSERGANRHDVGLFEGNTHDYDIATPLDADDPEVTVRHRARKDRRRWCKGKPGREHVLVVREPASPSWVCGPSRLFIRSEREAGWACYHQLVCERCSKVLMWRLPAGDCPDWKERNAGTENRIRDAEGQPRVRTAAG